MQYIENPEWREFYLELDEKKREEIYQQLIKEIPDDGANQLRKKIIDWRYHDPQKPGKRVDRGLWEMIVMPAHMTGFFASRKKIQSHISDSMKNLFLTEENTQDPVKCSAVYWEIRNIAKRFYETCKSPQYGRKLFGIQESSWEEKQVRVSHDIWLMSEVVPETFDMKEETKVFCDAVVDAFYEVSPQAEEIYQQVRVKMKKKRFPIVY